MLGIRSTGPTLHSAQTGSRHPVHVIEAPSPASGLLSPRQVAVAQRGWIEVILRHPSHRQIRTIRSSQRPCEACSPSHAQRGLPEYLATATSTATALAASADARRSSTP